MSPDLACPHCHTPYVKNGPWWPNQRPSRAHKARIARIIAEEAEETGTTTVKILSGDRHRPALIARHRAIRRIREEFPRFSAPTVAEVFGVHHTTVLYATGTLTTKGKVRPILDRMAA